MPALMGRAHNTREAMTRPYLMLVAVEGLAGGPSDEPDEYIRSLTETVLREEHGVPEDIAIEATAMMAVEWYRRLVWQDDSDKPNAVEIYFYDGELALVVALIGDEARRYKIRDYEA